MDPDWLHVRLRGGKKIAAKVCYWILRRFEHLGAMNNECITDKKKGI